MPKRKRKEEDRSPSWTQYFGVTEIRKRFQARITIDRKEYYHGLYNTPKEAAKAFDRAAIQAGRPTSSLNFLDQVPKNYKPKKKKLRSDNTIGYRGVSKKKHRFRAMIKIGDKQEYLGAFDTSKEAAIAWDLAAIQAKRPTSDLNFPDMIHMEVKKKISKKKKRKLVTKSTNETSFNGVSKIGKKFRASVSLAGKIKHFGIFTKARDAAMAYDTVIVELSGKSIDEVKSLLNFPNGMEKVEVEL